MELLVSFLFTLAILALLFWVIRRRPPVYRPQRRRVLALLQGVIDGTTSQEAWDLFISLPIAHDPLLETARRRCVALQEGDDEYPPCPGGLGSYLFNRDGRARIAAIRDELRRAIAHEPVTREF